MLDKTQISEFQIDSRSGQVNLETQSGQSFSYNLGAVTLATQDKLGQTIFQEVDGSLIQTEDKQRLTLAVFGDSRTRQNSDAANTLVRTGGYFYWATIRANGRLTFPLHFNFGVNGDTTVQMLSRIQPVLDCAADGVVVLASTNDRENAQITGQQSISNLDSIVTQILNTGKFVVLIAELPRGDTTFTDKRLSTTDLAEHFAVRTWVLAQAKRKGVFVVDPWVDYADKQSTFGDGKVNYNYDGLHPSSLGAKVIGYAVADVLCKRFTFSPLNVESNSDLFNASLNPRGNLISNGMLSGTGTATGWVSVAPAGVTATLTTGVDTDGTPYQQIQLSGTPTAANPIYEFRKDADPASLAALVAGDAVVVDGDFEVLAGSSGAIGSGLSSRFTYVGFSTIVRNFGEGFDTPQPTDQYRGYMETPPAVMPTTPATARARVLINLVQNRAVNITVRVRKMAMRKVSGSF